MVSSESESQSTGITPFVTEAVDVVAPQRNVYTEAHGELARSPAPVFAYFFLSITPSVKERQNGRSDEKKRAFLFLPF